MQLNLKGIAEGYCEGCSDVICHDRDNPPPIKQCFDRLLNLRKTIAAEQQTIALQEIAGDLKKIANPLMVVDESGSIERIPTIGDILAKHNYPDEGTLASKRMHVELNFWNKKAEKLKEQSDGPA